MALADFLPDRPSQLKVGFWFDAVIGNCLRADGLGLILIRQQFGLGRRRLGVVPRTGQYLCNDTVGKVISCTDPGQDGEWRYGVAWPEPRFEIHYDGVLEHPTRLLWHRGS